MDHREKRAYLIRSLLNEHPGYKNMEIPSDQAEQKRMLRSLFNIRLPGKIGSDFLTVQDAYLRETAR